MDWSRDGRFIVFARSENASVARSDIWALPASGNEPAFPVIESAFRKHGAKFSPDGRWVAYATDESGHDQVVVQPFPSATKGKWPVSSRGGTGPRWRGDGGELFYIDPAGVVVAVDVQTSADAIELGEPRPLFEPASRSMDRRGRSATFTT